MEPAAANVEEALDRAGLEYRAEANKSDASTQKAVAALAQPAQSAAEQLGNLTNEQLAGLIVGLAVLFLPKLDKRLVYEEAEQAEIAKAAVPVLNKYFPDGGLPCELVLLGTLAVITAPKLMSARGAPSKSVGGTAAGDGAVASTPSEKKAA